VVLKVPALFHVLVMSPGMLKVPRWAVPYVYNAAPEELPLVAEIVFLRLVVVSLLPYIVPLVIRKVLDELYTFTPPPSALFKLVLPLRLAVQSQTKYTGRHQQPL
jgi:hypothetical protein